MVRQRLPKHLQSRIHALRHLSQCSCRCWKHRRRLLLESSRILPWQSVWCPPWLPHAPLGPITRAENSETFEARSEEYGSWVMTGIFFTARNCHTTSDVGLGALQYCRNRCHRHSWRRFVRPLLSNLRKTCKQIWPVTSSPFGALRTHVYQTLVDKELWQLSDCIYIYIHYIYLRDIRAVILEETGSRSIAEEILPLFWNQAFFWTLSWLGWIQAQSVNIFF
jgi:hypothetical protein